MKLARFTWGITGLLVLFLALPISVAQDAKEQPAAKPNGLSTHKQKLSYGLGRNIGQSLKSEEFDVDIAALAAGIKDEFDGAEMRVPDAVKILQKELRTRAKSRREEIAKQRIEANPELKAIADKNGTSGAAYLKENQAKDGVKVTASGLQYEILKAGQGVKPSEYDVVETHYHGTLPDGKVFDSSVERKEPATFPVDGVIDGWTEALQMMPIGSKWRLVIPSQLAYGSSGSGEDIGPNQVLVFEVELLAIKTPDDEAPTEPAKKP